MVNGVGMEWGWKKLWEKMMENGEVVRMERYSRRD